MRATLYGETGKRDARLLRWRGQATSALPFGESSGVVAASRPILVKATSSRPPSPSIGGGRIMKTAVVGDAL